MKKSTLWLFAIISYGLFFTSCSKDEQIPSSDPKNPDPKEQVILSAREVLEKSDRVTIIKDTIDKDGSKVTYFYFKQPLDHEKPEAGSFKQYCVSTIATPTVSPYSIHRVTPSQSVDTSANQTCRRISEATIWRWSTATISARRLEIPLKTIKTPDIGIIIQPHSQLLTCTIS